MQTQRRVRERQKEAGDEQEVETSVLEATDEMLDEIDALLEDVATLTTYRQKGGQ